MEGESLGVINLFNPAKRYHRLLEVEAHMRDSAVIGRAAIHITLSNALTQPPVNTNDLTPTSGTIPAPGRPFVLVATRDGASGSSTGYEVRGVTDTSWGEGIINYSNAPQLVIETTP